MSTEDITEDESLTVRQDTVAESDVPGPDLDDDTRVSPRQWPFTLIVIVPMRCWVAVYLLS